MSLENRIDRTFRALKEAGQKGFIAYISAGDPNLAATVELAVAFEKCGVDVLELGLPFSDPLADGIVNQLAAQRALEAGATALGVLESVRQIRKRSELPIVIYTYMNPVFMMGFAHFFEQAAEAGVDGVLLLDLPPDEDVLDLEFAKTSGIRKIRLIAPTTPPERMRQIAERAEGFIYYVSRAGVTGEQSSVAKDIAERVNEIRASSSLPIAIGFGISTPEQAAEVAAMGDAVVVGSAIVKQMAKHGSAPDLVERVIELVQPLVDAVKKVEARRTSERGFAHLPGVHQTQDRNRPIPGRS